MCESMRRNLLLWFWVAIVTTASALTVDAATQTTKESAAAPQAVDSTPPLSRIVPLAAELPGRRATLRNQLDSGPSYPILKTRFDRVQAVLDEFSGQFARIKVDSNYKYAKLVDLRDVLKREAQASAEVSRPLNQEIDQLGAWRTEWLAEKRRWQQWQADLQVSEGLAQLKPTFDTAAATIEAALGAVVLKLTAALDLQRQGGEIQAQLMQLVVETEALIADERRSTLQNDSPPMFSGAYYRQFRVGVFLDAFRKGLEDMRLPDMRALSNLGWVVAFRWGLALGVCLIAYKNRKTLLKSSRWQFLGRHPLSAGVFFGFMATVLVYELTGTPGIWKLVNNLLGGVSFALLAGALVHKSWKRRFVWGLVTTLIIIQAMEVLGTPLPLFRLVTVLAALLGLIAFGMSAANTRRAKEGRMIAWGLRGGAVFLAFIVLAEIGGNTALAAYLFVSFLDSVATAAVLVFSRYLIRGGLEWLFRVSPLRSTGLLHSEDTDNIIRRVAGFFDILLWGLVFLPATLLIWGAYDSLETAIRGILALGFNVGGQRISLGLLIVAISILYGSFLVSWIVQKLLVDELLFKQKVERGVRLSIARLAHYGVLLVGFLWVLSTLGIEISKITIMLSALGVGIGFGLQGVVNNFVSGLILLFERPVRVGDSLEINGVWATVRRIGIRATRVQTFDRADLIIPNADLISNQVINWTLSNRQARMKIPIGVAYGSDVPLVIELLLSCAASNDRVATTPAPQALFLGFGASSLDFELRAFVWDADHRVAAQSALHQEIDRCFREAGIEIAFPQQDVHLRSIHPSVAQGAHRPSS